MKTAIKIILFCLGCSTIWIMVIASHSEWFGKYSSLFPNMYRYGDLYLQTNMPGFRIKDHHVKPVLLNKKVNTTLTIVGDSYTQHFDSSFFSSGSYRFIHFNSIPDTIQRPDRSKRNILIMECTERHARRRFGDRKFLVAGKKSVVKRAPEITLLTETHLQSLLTHYDWQLPFKELKTHIYLHWFDRFSSLVSKPDDGRLYLKETIDPEKQESSFNPISDAEIKMMVKNANAITQDLHELGFQEVYITIIPSPASIYKKENITSYNHLIERMQNDPSANFNSIDVYQDFLRETTSVYKCNDTHWNELGKMIWLIKVNRIINKAR